MTQTLEAKIKTMPNPLIGPDEQHFINRLNEFKATYLEEKLLHKGVFGSKAEYQEAFTEFKKYVALVGITGKPLPMTSEKVDEVWHQFILFTEEYHKFCQDFLGRYLHHRPETPSNPISNARKQELARVYSQIFGSAPEIWNFSKIPKENKAHESYNGASCTGCGSSGCSTIGCTSCSSD